jgi:hypothetical protein
MRGSIIIVSADNNITDSIFSYCTYIFESVLEINFLKIMETYVFMKDTFRIFLENPLAFLACLGYARSKENALIVCLNRFRKSDAAGATGS